MICKNCKENKRHKAKGYCEPCYDKLRRRQHRVENKGIVNKQQKEYYIRNKEKIVLKRKEDRVLNPMRHRARELIKRAIRSGTVIRMSSCSNCDNKNPEAHHDDYTKPFDVRWLCKRCHMQLHHLKDDWSAKD